MHETDYSRVNDKFDWGKTTQDYAKFRPAPPPSLYYKLKALDIGLKGQRILDLGTGLGPLARQFARQACSVVGVDRSPEQISMAKTLASQDGLSLEFLTQPVEAMNFSEHSFDAATAMQCWPYFKKDVVIPKLRKILIKNGLLVIGNFDHLPTREPVAKTTEDLILKFVPGWEQAGWDGHILAFPKWAQRDFNLKAMFYYDEPIRFTKESWRGRIRASQAISAYLAPEKVKAFDLEMQELLAGLPNKIDILHRLSVHVLELK